MKLSQKERILANDKLPEFKIGKTIYKGYPPHYQLVGVQWVKVAKGVPYVKVEKGEDNGS